MRQRDSCTSTVHAYRALIHSNKLMSLTANSTASIRRITVTVISTVFVCRHTITCKLIHLIAKVVTTHTVHKCNVTGHTGFGQDILGHRYLVTEQVALDKLFIHQVRLANLKLSAACKINVKLFSTLKGLLNSSPFLFS